MPGEDNLEFILSLDDDLTAVALKEAGALRQLRGEIDKTERSLRSMTERQIGYREKGWKGISGQIGIEVSKSKLHLQDLNKAVGLHQQSLAGLKKVASAHEDANLAREARAPQAFDLVPELLIADAIKKVGEVALRSAEEVAHLAFEFGKFGIEAAEFKENTTLAYRVVEGTADEGARTFEYIDKMARKVHIPAEQAHGLAESLMLEGFKDTHLIGSTIAANAALIRTGQIKGAEKLTQIIERSEASGHLDLGKLGGTKGKPFSGRGLIGLGVNIDTLMADLAKRLDVPLATVKQKLLTGKIDTEVGVASLVQSINKGVVGETARGKFGIDELTTDIKNDFRSMAQSIDLSMITQAFVDVDYALGQTLDKKGPLKNFLQFIVDEFAKLVDGALLFGVQTENAFLRAEIASAGLIHTLQYVDDKLDALTPKNAKGEAVGPSPQGNMAAYALGTAIFPFGGGGLAVAIYDEMKDIGMAGGEGLAAGILLNAPKATDAAFDVAADAEDSARNAVEARSPSKKFEELGSDMNEGLSIGLKGDDSLMTGLSSRQISEMISGIGAQAMAYGSGVPSSGASVGGNTGNTFHIQIENHFGSGGLNLERDIPIFEHAIKDVFERIAHELGA